MNKGGVLRILEKDKFIFVFNSLFFLFLSIKSFMLNTDQDQRLFLRLSVCKCKQWSNYQTEKYGIISARDTVCLASNCLLVNLKQIFPSKLGSEKIWLWIQGELEAEWTVDPKKLQRDVVYLGWLISPLYMSPNARRVGGGGVAGSQPMSTAVHRSPNKLWRSPYLTYGWPKHW